MCVYRKVYLDKIFKYTLITTKYNGNICHIRNK